jgi:hypothetical protein
MTWLTGPGSATSTRRLRRCVSNCRNRHFTTLDINAQVAAFKEDGASAAWEIVMAFQSHQVG